MIQLNTIGQLSIDVGSTRLTAASPQTCAALLYLAAERGREIPRATLVELLFPESEEQAGAHALRQLLYRLRKTGVHFDSNGSGVSLPRELASESIESAASRGSFTDAELDELSGGTIAGFPSDVSPAFSEWLDQFRATLSKTSRRVLLDQLRGEKEQHRYDAVERVARACLAIDPLNEEATLATAEMLAMRGSKSEAVSLLDRYAIEVGARSVDLHFAPNVLRERIAANVADPGVVIKAPIVGRDAEVTALRDMLARSAAGSAEACVVWGPSGIGKTRLLSEACTIAALEGITVTRCGLQARDQKRPLAILRDVVPRLLDQPGALGCSPDSLALLRGLSGRGAIESRDLPRSMHESEQALARVIEAAIDVVDAVCAEAPLLLYIEDAHWIDPSSLELIVELVSGERPLSVLIASQTRLRLPSSLAHAPRFSSLELGRLSRETSSSLVQLLFERAGKPVDEDFAAWSTGLADGVPFYLQSLFVEYLNTGGRASIPPSLTASLASAIDRLADPALSVFDAIVVLGSRCTLPRLDGLMQLPRHALLASLRELETRGLVKVSAAGLSCSHDLFALMVVKKMPASVSRTLHRAAAELLEAESTESSDTAWDTAEHWAKSGDSARARTVMLTCARDAWRLGRPQDAVEMLTKTIAMSSSVEERVESIKAALEACQAADESRRVAQFAAELIKVEEQQGRTPSAQLQVLWLTASYKSGQDVFDQRHRMLAFAADREVDAATRVRAATDMLYVSEDYADAEMARDSVCAIGDLPAERTAGARMVYETVFGDTATATELAHRIVGGVDGLTDDALRFGALYNCATVFWRCGDREASIAAYVAAFAIAEQDRWWSACVSTAAQLSLLYWSDDDPVKARAWYNRAGTFLTKSSFPDRATSYYAMAISLCLADGDQDGAERNLENAIRLYSAVNTGRKQVEAAAFRMRIGLARGFTPDNDSLDKLIAGYLKYRAVGMLDPVMATLLAGLIAAGRSKEAARLKAEYLSGYRREVFAPTGAFPELCDA